MSSMDENDNTSLERGASNDITRLRWRLKICENIIGRLVAENQRLRNGRAASCEPVACDEMSATTDTGRRSITDEERTAIATAADLLIGSKPGATLRNLLARLS